MMRARFLALFAVTLVLRTAGALAGGKCDLDDVVGYQVVFAKEIVAYIQAGKKQRGYEGCEPDRVLVFADNSGVRCKDLTIQHLDDLPMAYLFGKSMADLKLCVEGEMMVVSPTN
jgi:hypothetical protein